MQILSETLDQQDQSRSQIYADPSNTNLAESNKWTAERNFKEKMDIPESWNLEKKKQTTIGVAGKAIYLQETTPPILANVKVKHLKGTMSTQKRQKLTNKNKEIN